MLEGGCAGVNGTVLRIGGSGPSGTNTAAAVGSCQVSFGEGAVGHSILTGWP